MVKTLLYIAGGINIAIGGMAGINMLFMSLLRGPLVGAVSTILYLATGIYFIYAACKYELEPKGVKIGTLVSSILSLFMCNIVSFILGIIAYSNIKEAPAFASEEKGADIPKPQKRILTPEEKEERKMKNLLRLGVLLVILAGVIFATSAWATLTGEVKTIALIVSAILFYGLSYLAENKLKIKSSALTYYVLSNAFAVVSIISAGYFEIFGKWFSLNGMGSDLFFTVIWLAVVALSYLAYIKYDRRELLCIVYFATIPVIWHGLAFLNVPLDIVLMAIIILISAGALIKDSENAVLNKFCKVFLAVFMVALLYNIASKFTGERMIFNTISFAVTGVVSYYLALVNKNEIYRVLSPVLTSGIAVLLVITGSASSKVMFLQLLIIALVIYAVAYYKKSDKLFYNSSTVVSNILLFYVAVDSLKSGYNYFAIAAALMMLVTSIFASLNKDFSKYHFDRIIEPAKVLFLSYTVYRLFDSFEFGGEYVFELAVSTVFLVMYMLKKDFLKFVYFIGACLGVIIAYIGNLNEFTPIINSIAIIITLILLISTYFTQDKKYVACQEGIYAFLLLMLFTITNELTGRFKLEPFGALAITFVYVALWLTLRKKDNLRYITLMAMLMPYYQLLNNTKLPVLQEFIYQRVPWFMLIFIYTRCFLSHVNVKFINALEIVGLSVWYVSFSYRTSPVIALFVGIVAFISLLIGYRFDKYISLYYTGIAFTVINIIVQLKDIWREIPIWAYILIAGLILIGIVTYREYAKAHKDDELEEVTQPKYVAPELKPTGFDRTAVIGTIIYIVALFAMMIV